MRTLLIPVVLISLVLGVVALIRNQLAAIYQQSDTPITEQASRFPTALAGERFRIPADLGFHRLLLERGHLLAVNGARMVGQANVSLCDQRARNSPDSPLIPLYIGWHWNRLRERVDANLASRQPAAAGLKNPLLDDGPGGVDAPAIILDTQPSGTALTPYSAAAPLQLILRDSRPLAGLSDRARNVQAGPLLVLPFQRDAWLLWDAAADKGPWRQAMRIQRLPGGGCKERLGSVRITVYGLNKAEPSLQTPRPVYVYPIQANAVALRVTPGDYSVPTAAADTAEDAALFETTRAAGLVQADATGRLHAAPADLARQVYFARQHPERLLLDPQTENWLKLPWNDQVKDLHRLLYVSPAGSYLRQQMDIFNARRLLAAVRVRVDNPGASDTPAGAEPWRAEWQGAPLALTDAMPLLANGLFAEPPQGWAAWQRVERWPDKADASSLVRFILPLTPANGRYPLELVVVGQDDIRLAGAKVLSNTGRCLAAPPCTKSNTFAYALRLQPTTAARQLTIEFKPLPADRATALFRHDFAHIQADGAQWRWHTLTPAARRQRGENDRATVTVRDRAGALLWAQAGPTELARSLGLGGLVGLHRQHGNAVAGILARQGRFGAAMVDARLTLDSALQALARSALQEQLPKVSARFGKTDPHQWQRFASLVVLDADRGDILAAVSLPEPPRDVAWDDLYRFAIARPRRGPLYWWAWQHDGSRMHTPGSTFKLVSALTLERSLAQRPELVALLRGLSAGQIAREPLASRYGFNPGANCYPAHDLPCLHNFGRETLSGQVSDQEPHYGLEHALRDSLNTWFAWLLETTDATLLDDPQSSGLAQCRPLTPGALDAVRPLAAVTALLGFNTAAPLDGGLLPVDTLRTGDVLLTTPSRLDAITNRHEVRLAAVGFRMQVTPLQMAQVAADIATQKRVMPRLLLSVQDRTADEQPIFAPLGIETQRIRKGMKRVIEDGSADAAFNSARFSSLRDKLYAKTGTADLQERTATRLNTNNAWLVGWLEPNAIPNESRRLAFACIINQTTLTGGADCGQVVARFLAALQDAAKAPVAVKPKPQ